MSVIHDALDEAMASYTPSPTGYYVNYSLHRWGDGQEPYTDYYIGPYPKVVAEFLREYYLPTLSTYDGEYDGGRGTYVVLGGDKKSKPAVLARIEGGYVPGPNPSREAILQLIKQVLSESSILGAYVELQYTEDRTTAKEIRVRYGLHAHTACHEWQVQHNFRKENGKLACGSDQFLRLWWAPMEYVSVKYYHSAGEVGLVLEGDVVPTFPWWLVQESWWKRWGGNLDIRDGYRCLFVHIAIGYGTSAVLSTFPVDGSSSEHRTWFIDKLMGLPPDSLRIMPHWQDVDSGRLHQWPAIYRSYLLASLPLEGIRAVLRGPIDIDMAGGSGVTEAGVLLSIPVPKYHDGCDDGELLLLEGRHWVLRTADGDLSVGVTPHSGKYQTTTTERHTEKRGSITVRHITEECRCMYQELVLSGDITIVLGTKDGPIPIQKRTLTVIDTAVDVDGTETVHNPGITITVGGIEVPVQKLVRSNWDNTYLFLEGIDKSVPFDLLHRAAWSRRGFSSEVYESGLL